MRPASKQLVAEFDDCSFQRWSEVAFQIDALETSIASSGLTLVSSHSHRYGAPRDCSEPLGLTLLSIISESHVVIHTYPEASHVSVDIFTCSNDMDKPKRLLELLSEVFQPKSVRFEQLERGDVLSLKKSQKLAVSRHDGFEIMLPISTVLFDESSEFQSIQIVLTEAFGKVLVIDRQVQAAQVDLDSYFNALIGSNLKLAGSDILVLGGGDGVIASRLHESHVKSIDVVDIDPMVSVGCTTFFAEATRDVFQADAVNQFSEEIMHFLKKNRQKYQLVLADVSLHPESFTTLPRRQYFLNFFAEVKKLIEGGAVFRMQCCSEFDRSTIDFLEEILSLLGMECSFEYKYFKSYACRWVFAQVELVSDDS